MKLGVFGGTFDPVHVGHLVLAEAAREQLGLDQVLWMPAGDPWRKREQDVSQAKHRIELVRIAIADNPAFKLRTDEVVRQGPSYTVDTLSALKTEFHAHLFLLIGEDALWDLPGWKSPEKIVRLATLAVAGRGAEQPQPDLPDPLVRMLARPVWIQMPRIEVSSTDIRRRTGACESIRYLVPAGVEDYIRQTGLYRA
jgi:nicotinate-nucleotide adenylyltransferase